MVRTWVNMCGLAATLFLTIGCWTTEPNLKPPPRPEALIVPPADDPRFSAPIAYPKEAMNGDLEKKSTTPGMGAGPGGGSSRFGSSGMR